MEPISPPCLLPHTHVEATTLLGLTQPLLLFNTLVSARGREKASAWLLYSLHGTKLWFPKNFLVVERKFEDLSLCIYTYCFYSYSSCGYY